MVYCLGQGTCFGHSSRGQTSVLEIELHVPNAGSQGSDCLCACMMLQKMVQKQKALAVKCKAKVLQGPS